MPIFFIGKHVARAISQESLADEVGIDRTYASRLERKPKNPIVIVIEKIANALKVEIAELFADPGRADEKARLF